MDSDLWIEKTPEKDKDRERERERGTKNPEHCSFFTWAAPTLSQAFVFDFL